MPSISLAVSLRGQLLSGTRSVAPTPFSPIDLFASNEPGVWFDPSDLTTLFTDTAGTTPVTDAGQTVALMLDKSKAGVGTNGAARRNLLTWSEDFSNAAWVKTPGMTATAGAVDPDGGNTATTLTATSANVFLYQVRNVGGGAFVPSLWVRRRTGSGAITLRNGVSDTAITVTSTWTRVSPAYTSVSQNDWVLSIVTSGDAIDIWHPQLETGSTASSYQRITSDWPSTMAGNHATQATAASRPTYGVVPLGGRRNLLTWSEDFSNAAWAMTSATVATNTLTAPDGTLTADTITRTTTSGLFAQNTTGLNTANLQLTLSFYVYPPAGVTSLTVRIDRVGIGQGNQTVKTVVPETWSRVTHTVTLDANTQTPVPRIDLTGGASLSIWGAQLELGSTATAYQRVTTAFDVTEAGVQSLSYLSFDGVDDGMLTGTITPGVDKAQVFAGVRFNSMAATGVIAELSASVSANNGAFFLYGENTATYNFTSKGTTARNAASGVQTPPVTSVLTALGDIAGSTSTLRANGAQVGQSTNSQGTGNFLAYPLYVGRRGGTSLPFNGQIFSLITRFGANLDAPTITNTEYWVGDKTGINIANNIAPTIFARDDTAVLDRANSIIERRA